jgi:Helix-turn-helix domain
MSAVWELDLLPQDKFILLAFADHADDSGYCYPSLHRICWKCGVSKDSIRRCLARMVFKGIVVILQKGTGRGHTTRYQLRTQKGSKLPPFFVEGSQLAPERVATGEIKGSTLTTPESSLEPSLTVNRLSPTWKLSEDGHAAQCPTCNAEIPNSRAAIRRHKCLAAMSATG